MKPILLGQAPARSGDGRPFSGASGRKLCALTGLEYYDELAEAFDLRNLVTEVQMRKARSKGDLFPKATARENWDKMKYRLPMDFVLLCAGRQVASIVGVGKEPFFSRTVRVFSVVGIVYVIPHPSGISHWWNDPQNVREAQAFLKRVIGHA